MAQHTSSAPKDKTHEMLTLFANYERCGICPNVCSANWFGYAECMEGHKKDGTILGKGNKREELYEGYWTSTEP